MLSNTITLQLTPLQAECLQTLIDMYGHKHYANITLIGGEEGHIDDVLQAIAEQLPDTAHYYKIVDKHAGEVIGRTACIANVLEEEYRSSFVEMPYEEWRQISLD